MMLLLVGTGLSYNDISMRAVDACKGCELYIERYTSFIDDNKIKFLEQTLGKKINVLERNALEDDVKVIINKAKTTNVALLVGGDPLVATTHKIIFIEALKQKVETHVYHASSIISCAVGESGLDFYRFGQICTISKWSDNYKPISFYESIEKNLNNNLHSILLLDYDPKNEKSLDVSSAVAILENAEQHYKKKIVTDSTKVFVMHNLSLSNQSKLFVEIKSAKEIKFEKGPTLLIIPAKMSDIEQETVKSMYTV
jgi:diphthine synthase